MFSKDFVFGTGISSYQTEGGEKCGHRLSSIWDTLSRKKGAILDHSTGAVADDFYHRYPEDIANAKALGIQAFRFSVSWCRLIRKNGTPNPDGIRFYRSVLTEIIRSGMTPVMTIYHWDMPQIIADKTDFSSRRILLYFRQFVQVIADNFSDLCSHFLTFNEPQCFVGLAYTGREHAPCVRYPTRKLVASVHHVLLCHALATEILKKANPKAEVGFVNTITVPLPKDPTNAKLVKACAEKLFSVPQNDSEFTGASLWMDPLLLGHYPKAYLTRYHRYLSCIRDGDMERIRKAKASTIYLNIYTGRNNIITATGQLQEIDDATPSQRTSFSWLTVHPEALKYGPLFCYQRYHKPIVISENGVPYEDTVENERIHDAKRSSYIRSYLKALAEISDTVPIQGYYYWSLLDNFEWAYGYTKRFGLLYVDYAHGLRRIRKDSFETYRKLIAFYRKK